MTALPVRIRVAALAVAAVTALAGCAAGQLAQTSDEVSAIDGVNRDIGKIAIRGLAIEAPTSTNSWPSGSDVVLKLVLVNTGSSSDSLIGMTSSSISSWAGRTTASGADSQKIDIAPGSRVAWGTPEATGTLRLLGLKSALYPGNAISVTLRFARAGSVTAQVPVQLSAEPGTASIEEPSGSSGE